MTFLFTFIVTLVIGSFMNILLKTTKKSNWLGTLAVALVVSIVATIILVN